LENTATAPRYVENFDIHFDDAMLYVADIETVYRRFDISTRPVTILLSDFVARFEQFLHPVDDQFAGAQAQRETGN